MNRLKKGLPFLIAFGFMLPPKAAAESLSYGVKVGFATSFARLNDKQKENGKQYLELDSRMWNPSFGVALYMEYALNDHLGLGAELLYNRFDQLVHMKLTEDGYQKTLQSLDKPNDKGVLPSNEIKIQTSFDTIGLPMLLTWYWTSAVRPDFKDDYFLGRLFVGVHPFYLVARTYSVLCQVNGKTHKKDIEFPKDDQKDRLPKV
ncbi:MAG: PorT family protein [Candidatus Cardinium sp.]|mgnify:CR=1 FL=1|uniref:PorT family protein n=1 Tax=Cardinium endosymbiont of Dermatophagoides farinae TaxID=2597823 RepID=UPI001183F1CD|nr:PorT family protein [Cardinium endosymbiont of Dermatophagoides farinae]TSJ81173.1 PorT family protein [Cardinium endosymbiont of Dermatophagoides farinae]UWW97218.1 MAG: PorT family protein [Candidatus Cardinium sp.]